VTKSNTENIKHSDEAKHYNYALCSITRTTF